LELYKSTYPRDWRAPGNLSDAYLRTGQFEKAAGEARAALNLNPNAAAVYVNLGQAFISLSRFAEAKQIFQQAQHQNLDTTIFHTFLYQVGFVGGDPSLMQQQLDWTRGKPDEYVGLDWQSQSAGFAGQWRRSQDFSGRAIELASRSDAREVAAQYVAEEALRGAAVGQCSAVKAATAKSAGLERNIPFLSRAAVALALCGDTGQAQSLIDELTRERPKDTFVNLLWVPVIRSAIQINRNNPTEAVQLLEPTRRFEAAAEFWPQYLRGLAYLKLKSGTEAATEFQKILDNRGQATLSALYPLAQLGLARAAAVSGDMSKSRKVYQDFLALWKDADSDLPVLKEAEQEYEKLQ
jgi:predicted Zn-dependent protease